MTLRRVIMTSVALLVGHALVIAQAAPEATMWDGVSGLGKGTRVRVTLVDGSEIRGHLLHVADDSLVIEKNEIRRGPYSVPAGASLRGPLSFHRSDISTVQKGGGWIKETIIITSVAVGVAMLTALLVAMAGMTT
jgi:hypothetical protein